jgi:hypothetical protein
MQLGAIGAEWVKVGVWPRGKNLFSLFPSLLLHCSHTDIIGVSERVKSATAGKGLACQAL